MPLNLASPGILVREVDLTLGRIDPTSDKIGGIVGPFAQGPVGQPTVINSENELLNNFGRPYDVDKHYETWYSASSYLAYGGQLNVVRADDSNLKNGFIGSADNVKIKSSEHYEELGYDNNTLANVTFAAKNPGSWSNGIRIGFIDSKADQILTIDKWAEDKVPSVGYGISQSAIGVIIAGAGTTSELDGYFKGIITEVDGDTTGGKIGVKFLSHVSAAGTEKTFDYNSTYKFRKTGTAPVAPG